MCSWQAGCLETLSRAGQGTYLQRPFLHPTRPCQSLQKTHVNIIVRLGPMGMVAQSVLREAAAF